MMGYRTNRVCTPDGINHPRHVKIGHRRTLYIIPLLVAIGLFIVGSYATIGYATLHAAESSAMGAAPMADLRLQDGDASLEIVSVNTADFPIVELDLQLILPSGEAGLPDALPAIDSGLFRVVEGGETLPAESLSIRTPRLNTAFLIDPVHLADRSYSGQTYEIDIAYALHDLFSQEVFLRNSDRLAAFSLLPDGTQQTIQAWTTEPNLIYNSFAQDAPAALDADLLPTDAWLNVIGRFAPLLAGDSGSPEAPVEESAEESGETTYVQDNLLILFLVGSQSLPSEFVTAAAAQNIGLTIIDHTYAIRPAESSNALMAVAEKNGGQYIKYQDATSLNALTQSILNRRGQLKLRYQSSLPEFGPATVSLTLPSGQVVPMDTATKSNTGENFSTNGIDLTAVPIEEPAAAKVAAAGPQPVSTELPIEEDDAQHNDSTALAAVALESTSSDAPNQDGAPQDGKLSESAEEGSGSQDAGAQSASEQSTNKSTESSAKVSENDAVVAGDQIILPLLDVAVPRLAVQLTLPLLVLLIAYIAFVELRERRSKKLASSQTQYDIHPQTGEPLPSIQSAQMLSPTPTSISVTDPYANFQPLEQRASNSATEPLDSAVANVEFDASARSTTSMEASSSNSNTARIGTNSVFVNAAHTSEERNQSSQLVQHERTTTPLPQGPDDDATFRLQDVDVPIVGNLMRVTSDPGLPQRLPIHQLELGANSKVAQRQLYIGRHSQKNTIVINDHRISREHAVIVQKEGELFLRDNGSSSGTFLNWKRLQAGDELVMRDGDLVSLGHIVYEFRLSGDEQATILNG